jgi:SAM-dependent methyltransferase
MLGRIKGVLNLLNKYVLIKKIRFGSIRRLKPVDREFGFNLGTPVDRHYIEKFLDKHRHLIKGEVLEIGEDSYTSKFASADFRLTILNVVEKDGCIRGDLESGSGIPENSFDCIIMTQTLPFIFDLGSAISNVYKALRPNGYVLATNPCISQISRFDMDRWGDYWRFTHLSLRKLFEQSFSKKEIEVTSFGNCLTATCFIQGIPAEKLSKMELEYIDRDYPVTLTVVAKKT